MSTRIEISMSELAAAIEIAAGRIEGNKADANLLLNNTKNMIAFLPEGFDLKQFQK